ncbi:translation initiation factor IF-2-like [Lutra lutra]|uniref:translation initiation factor IF-2-like n=1 Tax=Lutra lutra TaxID=9657 RepID=UPI001FD126F2|nr:translation initiation factor IF-2-like [Lutra lutra]
MGSRLYKGAGGQGSSRSKARDAETRRGRAVPGVEAGAQDRSQIMQSLVRHIQDFGLYPKSSAKSFRQWSASPGLGAPPPEQPPQQQAGGGRRAARGLGRGAAPARLRPTVPAPRGAGSRWLPSAPGVRPARASRAGFRPRGGPGGGESRGDPAGRAGPPRARAGRRGVPSARSARPPPQHLALADPGPRGRDTSRGAAARKEGPGGRRRPGGSRRQGSPAPAGAQERRLPGFPPNPKLFQPTQACSSRVSAAGGAVRERLGTHTRPPTRGRRSRGRASGSPRKRPLRFPLPLGLQLRYCCGLKKVKHNPIDANSFSGSTTSPNPGPQRSGRGWRKARYFGGGGQQHPSGGAHAAWRTPCRAPRGRAEWLDYVSNSPPCAHHHLLIS